MDTSKVEPAVRERFEFVTHLILVAEQILRPPGVACEQQDVLVADRPEIGDCTVLTRPGEDIAFDELSQVGPGLQILRKEQVLGHPAVVEERSIQVGA